MRTHSTYLYTVALSSLERVAFSKSSYSLMHRVRYTRGSPHGNGQCAFLPSSSSSVYRLDLVYCNLRNQKKPSFRLHNAPLCTSPL